MNSFVHAQLSLAGFQELLMHFNTFNKSSHVAWEQSREVKIYIMRLSKKQKIKYKKNCWNLVKMHLRDPVLIALPCYYISWRILQMSETLLISLY